ncbi:MAG: hypothetical protein PUP46_07940 [Endozoicomonas sp. (ex Botrylloides leachii)]|nr:hypothetical protein [Endozoicomonas sp. (ex Botrylloides leachii)]
MPVSNGRQANVTRLVIVVVGPMGWGKTTLGEALVKRYPDEISHIDGDSLAPSMSLPKVLQLKEQRNQVTWSCIASVIAKGKIPVISTGGGALCCEPKQTKRRGADGQGDEQNRIALLTFLSSLGINATILLFVPGRCFEEGADEQYIAQQYADETALDAEFERRQARGTLLAVDKNKLKHAMMANNQFAHRLMAYCRRSKAGMICSYPRLLPQSNHILPVIKELDSAIKQYKRTLSVLTSLFVQRIELICQVQGWPKRFYHQTFAVNNDNNKKIAIPETYPKISYTAPFVKAFDVVTKEPLGEFVCIPGSVYTDHSVEGRSPHITIKLFKYRAKEMGILAKYYWQVLENKVQENPVVSLLNYQGEQVKKSVAFETAPSVRVTPYVLNYHT